MADKNSGIIEPPIDELLSKVDSKYQLVIFASKRARQVRAAMPDAVLVFLLPPSWEELVRRLIGRGTESPDEQARRLETARIELAAQDEFDELVVNDDVPRAAQEVVDLLAVPSGGARPAGRAGSAR